jgi:hypothetical protein
MIKSTMWKAALVAGAISLAAGPATADGMLRYATVGNHLVWINMLSRPIWRLLLRIMFSKVCTLSVRLMHR